MATFSRLYLTKTGQTLLARLLSGSISGIEYTTMKLSSQTYAESAVENLTSLSNVKQTGKVNSIKRVNNTNIEVDAIFPNSDLTTGYYVKTVGLYVMDPTARNEVLYAVCVESGQSCYMPAYNNQTQTDLRFKLTTNVSNAQNVSLAVNPAAVATIYQVEEIHQILDHNILRIENSEEMMRTHKSYGAFVDTDGVPFIIDETSKEILMYQEDPFKDIDDRFKVADEINVLRDKRISEAYRQIQTKADQTQADDLQNENDRQSSRLKAIETELETGIEQKFFIDTDGKAFKVDEESDEFLIAVTNRRKEMQNEIARLESLINLLYKQASSSFAVLERKIKSAFGELDARISELEAAE